MVGIILLVNSFEKRRRNRKRQGDREELRYCDNRTKTTEREFEGEKIVSKVSVHMETFSQVELVELSINKGRGND